MADFSPQIALAQRLIKEKGAAIKVRRFTDTPVDSTKPWLGSTVVATDHNAWAVFLPLSAGALARQWGYPPEQLDPQANEIAYLAAGDLSFELSMKDFIIKPGGKQVKILKFDLLAPDAQQLILYTLQVGA